MTSAFIFDPLFFSQLHQPTTFYLLRHGESTANAELRIQGRSDFPLSSKGRIQAKAAASRFRPDHVGMVFCSPQSRARETAEIICTNSGLAAPQDLPDLMELDTGCFTGLTFDEARSRYPEIYSAFQVHSWTALPDAEPPASLMARALRVWEQLRQAACLSGSNIMAVTHGGLIQWLVRITFGCASWMPLLTTGNCGLFELKVTPHGPALPATLQWREINHVPLDGTSRTPPVF